MEEFVMNVEDRKEAIANGIFFNQTASNIEKFEKEADAYDAYETRAQRYQQEAVLLELQIKDLWARAAETRTKQGRIVQDLANDYTSYYDNIRRWNEGQREGRGFDTMMISTTNTQAYRLAATTKRLLA